MNPQKQIIKLAKYLGWKVYKTDGDVIKSWRDPAGSVWKEPWTPLHFLDDLNHIREVENHLAANEKERHYLLILADIVRPEWVGKDDIYTKGILWAWKVHTASAAQRAEAALKTIGKWEE